MLEKLRNCGEQWFGLFGGVVGDGKGERDGERVKMSGWKIDEEIHRWVDDLVDGSVG